MAILIDRQIAYGAPEKCLRILDVFFGGNIQAQHGLLDQILSVLSRSSLTHEESQQAGKMRGAVRIRLGDIERTESHLVVEKYGHGSADLRALAACQDICAAHGLNAFDAFVRFRESSAESTACARSRSIAVISGREAQLTAA